MFLPKTRKIILTFLSEIAVVCFVGQGISYAQAPSGMPPLPEAEQQAFLQIKQDKAPPRLAQDKHYVTSNERFHFLYQPLLSKQPGGVYVGVGTDQNYLMAGWQKPEVLVLMDFDQMVVDVHRVYQVMFLHAKTKEEFLNLWRSKDPVTKQLMAPQIKQWITEEFGEVSKENPKICGLLCRRVIAAYEFSQKEIFARLSETKAIYQKQGDPCFLTDDGQYQYLVSMFAGHRVFYFRGDLSQHGLGEIAKALQKTHRTLGVLYVSNAELYFPYVSVGGQTSFFSQHMKEMPVNEHSLTLHTWALGAKGGYYAYFFHKTPNFVEHLHTNQIKRFPDLAKEHIRYAQGQIPRKMIKQGNQWIPLVEKPRALINLDEPATSIK